MFSFPKKRLLAALLLLIGGVLGFGLAPSPVAAAPPPCADLVITGLRIESAQGPFFPIIVGQPAKIEIDVKNQGTCQSLSFTVQWKQSPLSPTGPSQEVTGGLAADQTTTVSFDYIFTDVGDFQSQATVDTQNTVDETNESNNIEIAPVSVKPDLPDLRVESFLIDPEEPTQGVDATIYVTVRNQGSKDAGPFTVQWKSDRFAPTGPSQQVPSLAAYASTTLEFTYAFPNAGNFTTVVEVDTGREVQEWDEDNNLAILATTVHPSAPDLVIPPGGFQITAVDPAPGFPLLPVAGLKARIDLTILNQGNVAAGPFVVQWKSSRFAASGPDTQVPGLGVGETTDVVFEYTFPNAGNFTTVATVDTNGDVRESNENNNLEIKSITVQEAVIDLIITEFKVEPAPGVPASIPPNPVQNRLTRATVTVKNVGNYPAGDFRLQWKPALLGPDLSAQNNGLKYGESKTYTFDYTYPNAGQVTSQAKVDSTNQVQESDETNNTATLQVTVEPELPDLIITEFKFQPAEPVQGTEATALITVQNRGNTPAGPFLVEWKPTGLTPDQTQQINGLGVGEETTISFKHTYGFAGTFNTTATVDKPNRVQELNEDNNTWTRQVVVHEATNDLEITDMSISHEGCEVEFAAAIVEPELLQGSPVQVCITVQNWGNSPVGPFVVRWNPDAFGLITPSPGTVSQQVDLLGAGQSTLVVFDFTYTQSGNFRTVAEVDAFKTIPETNEENNLSILNVVVEGTGPNLVIDELVVTPDFFGEQIEDPGDLRCFRGQEREIVPPDAFPSEPVLTVGQRLRVCIIVRNAGNQPAGPFVVSWNPDTTGLITPSPKTQTQQVEHPLEPGQAELVEFFFIYTQAGTFRTLAEADAFNNVPELNEADNLKLLDVIVEEDKPDLVITNFQVVPFFGEGEGCEINVPRAASLEEPILVQGNRVRVCLTVRNAGFAESGPFVVSWNPDALGLLTPSPGTQTSQVPNLDPFQQTVVVFDFTYHKFSEFRTVAEVDAFNDVDESNEANNKDIVNVIVNPAPIDLRITSFTLNPSSPVRGSKVTASITVLNDSTYPTEAFSVQWKITGEDGSGPFARIQGLHPGQSETVELEGTFFIAGDYTSLAIVDVFDEIIETNENNNQATRSVDAQPRVQTLRVTFNSVIVKEAFEDGIDGNAEWWMLFFVLDPEAEDGFQQQDAQRNAVEDGDVLNVNRSFNVTLEEATPLVFAATAFEVDDFLGIPTGGKFLGFTAQLWTLLDRWGEGTFTIPTIPNDEDPCSDGCFEVRYTVQVISEPPPFFGLAEGLPVPEVMLPAEISDMLPDNVAMPKGIQRPPSGTDAFPPEEGSSQLYLPLIQQ